MMQHRSIPLLILFILYLHAEELPPRQSQPPTIILQPERSVKYFKGSSRTTDKELVELPCTAIGSPNITFQWLKDGEPFNPDDPNFISKKTNITRVVQFKEDTGTLVLSELESEDSGIYQCIASNAFGKSYSRHLHLVEAKLGVFKSLSKEEGTYKPVLGESLKLSCEPPESIPPPKIDWVRYDAEDGFTFIITKGDDRIETDFEGNLYFANIQQQDDNNKEKYGCSVHNHILSGTSYGYFSWIHIQGGMKTEQEGDSQMQFPTSLLYQSQKEVVGLKGRTVKFKCIFGGNPTPTIQWKRIDGTLDKTRIIQETHELVIQSVQREDEGQYQCVGTNALSDPLKYNFTLRVESKPEWIREPRPVEKGVEEEASFACNADGIPKPVIKWFSNGKPLETLPPSDRRRFVNNQLIFINLTRDDAQVIQCNASNDHGYLWADVSLSILAFKPEIKIPLMMVKVAEDQSVVLPCETIGKPNPVIYWKKGVQKLEGDRYIPHPSGNLTLKNAEKSDEGSYTCYAQNKYGAVEATGQLIVRKKTEITSPPFPKEQLVRFGSVAHFKCSATTDDQESKNLGITWLHNGIPVDLHNPDVEITDAFGLILKNTSSKNTGNYTCVATNGLDSASASAQLNVLAPPDPPRDVSVSACKPREVELHWNAGSNNFSPIKYFIIEYNNTYKPDKWKEAGRVDDPLATSHSITVSPHVSYTFRVIAVNELGQSQPSRHSNPICQTGPAPPDKHPSNIRDDRSKPGFLIVQWDIMEQEDHNGEGFAYEVVIKKDGKTETYIIDDWKNGSKEIPVDTVYEPYEVTVTARNNLGVSTAPPYTFRAYSAEAEPLVTPSNFELVPGKEVTDTEAWFQWDAVDTSPAMMRGEFKGYKIRYWHADNKELKTEIDIPKANEMNNKASKRRRRRAVPKSIAVAKNLPPFSNLELDVVAVNTHYASNGSNSINLTTPEGVPGQVSYAAVLVRGAHHFLLEWGQPKEINGVLTGFEIGHKKINGLVVGEMSEPVKYDDPNQNRAFLGGLEDRSEYRIFIWAKTRKGPGEPYFLDAKTAHPAPPQRPEIVHIFPAETYLNVSWKVAPSNEPVGSIHYVEYRKTGDSEWKKGPDERLYHWSNISGLQTATRYEVRIVASNGKEKIASDIKSDVITAGASPVAEGGFVTAGWFIGMMIAIAVLILILIIVCFIKRSRGKAYHVQEKERLNGADPEGGEGNHNNDIPRSEAEPLTKSPDSFDNDNEKPLGGSETDSMAEYGDVDPSKFNEDGSFIGQYGGQKAPSEAAVPSAMSTFV
ncbi:hypothetical protein CHS0354_016099 [Potamilus streckersoni]|uniref:Neuronal cell adhesion molecule n=1 Tax=Potamilus streckersoni TaxID=2493646 RepID=A0AAE0T1W1_9BIVA|nr:hypothetical protein CHS0354_016099 [Potamilus streckersoni]